MPTTIFQDHFTEPSSDTDLGSHTPDTGTSWTKVWGTDAASKFQVKQASDELGTGGSVANSGALYSADVTYPDADYAAQVKIVSGLTGTNRVYLIVRMQDQENMYALRFTTGGTATRLYKKVSGTWTALGSFVADPADGDTVRVEVVGPTLKFYYNGVLKGFQVDTAISAAGKAGLGLGGGAELAASTDDITSQLLDDFLVETIDNPIAVTQFASSVTSMPVNLPTPVSGDLLLAWVSVRNAGTWTLPSGWAELVGQAGGGAVGETTVFYKISDGTEGATDTWTASTGTTGVWQVMKIHDWHGTTPPEITSTNGDSSAADSPNITPSWGSDNNIWISIAGHAASSIAAWSAGPSGYSTMRMEGASSGGAAACIASAYKQSTASSENPGAFTVSGSNRWWAAVTVAVRPVSSGPTEVNVQKGLIYDVKYTPSAKTKSLKYTVERTPSAITKSLAYDIERQVAPTKSLKYCVKRTPAAVTKSLKYTVEITPAGITKGLIYMVEKQVAPTKSLRYVIEYTPSAITKGLIYDIETTPSALTKSLRYAVKITPSAITKGLIYSVEDQNAVTKGLQYMVKRPVALTKSLKYTIEITASAITKGLTYAVEDQNAVTKSLQYAVERQVAVTKSLKYTVEITAGAVTKSLKYTVIITPSAVTKSLRYLVDITIAAITKSLEYVVTATAGIDVEKDLTYAVVVEVAKTKSLQYAVERPASALTKGLQYAIRRNISTTKGLTYEIETSGSVTKGLIYRVTIQGAVTKSLEYAVSIQGAITKGLRYAIEKGSAVTKSLGYGVNVEQVKTKSLQYSVTAPHSAITKSVKYVVTIDESVTKSLRYSVVKSAALTKGLRYSIEGVEVAVEKELGYMVTKERSVTLSLGYVIRIYPYTKKSLTPFTKKESPFAKKSTDPYSKKESPFQKKNPPYQRIPKVV